MQYLFFCFQYPEGITQAQFTAPEKEFQVKIKDNLIGFHAFLEDKPESIRIKTVFSWGPVETTDPVFYLLEIKSIWGDDAYYGKYVEGMLSSVVPEGTLSPGNSYIWRVRVADTPMRWKSIISPEVNGSLLPWRNRRNDPKGV